MDRFVRLISACSIVTLGMLATPVVASAEPAPSEETSAAEAKHGHARRVLEQALADLELRPEQKEALEDLKTEARERHAPVKAAKRELMMAVADQVEAGKIERCEVAQQIDKAASAMAKAHPGDREAFERLHSILDKEQRSKFVDALKQHWESHARTRTPDAMVDKIDRALQLSDEQKGKLRQIFSGLQEIGEAAHSGHREKWSKILEAFKGDKFELDEIAPMGDVAAMRRRGIEGHLWAAEAVVPVLNKEQRAKVAQMLRDKAGEGEREGGGGAPGMDPTDEE